MGKKTTTTKTAAPAKRAAKPAVASQRNGTAKAAVRAKPAGAAKAPKRAAKPRPSKPAGITVDDIALRAYFIAEKRRSQGLPGDEHQDWLEAERQLSAESKTAKNGSGAKASVK